MIDWSTSIYYQKQFQTMGRMQLCREAFSRAFPIEDAEELGLNIVGNSGITGSWHYQVETQVEKSMKKCITCNVIIWFDITSYIESFGQVIGKICGILPPFFSLRESPGPTGPHGWMGCLQVVVAGDAKVAWSIGMLAYRKKMWGWSNVANMCLHIFGTGLNPSPRFL